MLDYLDIKATHGIFPKSESDKMTDTQICKTRLSKHIIIYPVYSMHRPTLCSNIITDETIYYITLLDTYDCLLKGYE